jgi:Leucine-rich repeat (LRR) protein
MVEKLQLSPATFSGLYDGKDKTVPGKNDAFTGLNLDKLGLSKDAQNKVMWARSQFELNFQVFNSMNNVNGEKSFQKTFSFKASYEFLQMASGQEISEPEMTE